MYSLELYLLKKIVEKPMGRSVVLVFFWHPVKMINNIINNLKIISVKTVTL